MTNSIFFDTLVTTNNLNVMIHAISFKNFYSFSEEASIDFEVNSNAPKNNGYFTAPSDTRLSKVLTVIGPNASGKTNLLKPIPFLKWLIVDSFMDHPTDPLPLNPFLFCDKKDTPTEFSATFEIDSDIFIYSFILNKERILEEDLKIQNKTKENITKKTLFNRKWQSEEKKYLFSATNFSLPKDFGNESLLRSNASVISTAMRLNHSASKKIGDFWEKVKTNVFEAGWVGDRFFSADETDLIDAFNFFSENEDLKQKAEKLLARFDLGFNQFDIKKEKRDNGFSINVQTVHYFDGHHRHLPIQYESSGTKQLFMLLKTILHVLAHGGVAVLDELDVNLHPDMILALFELFLSPETNPKNAQILFSTHSHRILNELDKYQLILVEKNEKGASESWRLDEMDGVRPDDNYYAKYIAGAYGAIPNIN